MENNCERYCVPIIGSVGCGKSTFLNSFININNGLLEEGLQTTTKFVCIIRHNPKLTKPIFYHICLKKLNTEVIYKAIEERVEGENNIREAIKKINCKAKANNDIDFRNLLYILEINIKFVENTTFFEKYDLLDIPGLDEANTNYAETLINCLKDKIKFCIYMFNSNYYKDEKMIEIIKTILKKCNLVLYNSLIILNKIDDQKDKDSTLREFSCYLMEKLDDKIFSDSNSIIGLDSTCLRDEELANNNMKCLLSYYLKKYKEDIEKGLTFSEIIKVIISNIHCQNNKNIYKENLNDFIQSKADKICDDTYKEISDTIEILIEQFKSKGFDISLDLDDEDIIDKIKALSECFEEKLIFIDKSPEKEELINYFLKPKDLKMENIKNSNDFLEDESIKIRRKFMERMLNFFNGIFKDLIPGDKDIEIFRNKAIKLLQLFFENEKLRIPVIGCYNSGKSSILNNFIGDNILPVDSDECTRKIVFIRYNGNRRIPVLHKAKLKEENFGLIRYYLDYDQSYSPIEGSEHIRNFLQAKNDNRKRNYYLNDITEDLFYVVETKIDILDKLELPEELKNRIEFIDIPGLNTGLFNGYEGRELEKVISVSNLFLFVNPIDKAIKDESNKNIMKILIKGIETRISSKINISDSFIFLINKSDIEKGNEIELETLKKEFSNILDVEAPELIQLIKFSSKEYSKYLNSQKYYVDFKWTINRIENKYKKSRLTYNKTLEKFLCQEIKNQIKNDFNLNRLNELKIEKSEGKDYFFIIMNNYHIYINNEMNEIVDYLIYGRNNLTKIEPYKKSGIKNLLPILKKNILNSNNLLNQIYVSLFSPFLKNDIMIFFNRDKDKKITNEEIERLNITKKNLKERLNKILGNYNLLPLLEEVDKKNKDLFKNFKDNASNLIKDKNNEEIINELSMKIEENFKDFIKRFETELNNIQKEISNIEKDLNKEINSNNKNENISLDNIHKLDYTVLDKINKSLFIIPVGGLFLGGLICELTTSITYGFLGGGVIGGSIGLGVGIGIFAIRQMWKKLNKKEDFLKLLEDAKNQYNFIFDGLKFQVEKKIKEAKTMIEDLINNATNFLNKQIDSIQEEQWNKAKKEIELLSKEFDSLFGPHSK